MPISNNGSKYSPTSFKGYYGIMKAVVTRNILHWPKPSGESKTGKKNNIYDVQIWIPAYHGAIMGENGPEPDPHKIGKDGELGVYPWAQVCAPIFKDQIGKDEDFPDVFSSMFYGKHMSKLPSAYPAVGDVVFVMFEGGDIGSPVVMGSLLCEKNEVKYFSEYSGDGVSKNLATRLEGREIDSEDEE